MDVVEWLLASDHQHALFNRADCCCAKVSTVTTLVTISIVNGTRVLSCPSMRAADADPTPDDEPMLGRTCPSIVGRSNTGGGFRGRPRPRFGVGCSGERAVVPGDVIVVLGVVLIMSLLACTCPEDTGPVVAITVTTVGGDVMGRTAAESVVGP